MDKTSEDFKHLTNDVRPHREEEWLSIFHQLSIPVCLDDVQTVLEFGPGRGLMGAIMKHYGMDYYAADVFDFGAKPDFLCSIKEMSLDKTFDLVCAFQALEHNPPEDFLPHLKKMRDLSNKYVYISLPYHGRWFGLNLSIGLPRFRKKLTQVLTWPRLINRPRPIEKYRKSENPFIHHWFEVGDKGFTKKDITRIGEEAGLKQRKAFHSSAFPYHYFILFEKI